jgi:hypothetical protein
LSLKVTTKANVSLYVTVKAQRGRKAITLLYFKLGAIKRWWSTPQPRKRRLGGS